MTSDTQQHAGVVIIGAGQAGSEAAFALRTAGYSGSIDLIAGEVWAPYRRPPLSKQFIANDAAPETLYIKPVAAYEKADIRLSLGTSAVAIDRATHQVSLSDGRRFAYDQLILATGGSARQLRLPGSTLHGIHSLRSVDDALAIRAAFQPGKHLVIVGGGFVGLEVAALAIQHGLRVTLLEAAPRLLSRVTSETVSDFFASVHVAAGVQLIFNAQVQSFEGDTAVSAVRCGEERIAADLVLIGIGMRPADELAASCGLNTDQGVRTDAWGSTSDADVFAIGDCARSWRQGLDRYACIESVPNAIEQARVVAQIIVGKPRPELQAPWFWSDQYDLKLQMAGLSEGYDAFVVRGTAASRSFMVFYLRAGRVIAADAVNRVAEFNIAKKIVGERCMIDMSALQDETRALRDFVAG